LINYTLIFVDYLP